MLTRRLLQLSVLGTALAPAACVDRPTALSETGPQLQRANNAGTQVEGYRHFGEFVELVADSQSFVVEGEVELPVAELSSRLSAVGLQVAESKRMPAAGFFYEVRLNAAQFKPRGEVLLAARSVPGVRFMAPVYRDADGALLRPLNLVEVQLREGASATELDGLLRRNGLELVSGPARDSGRTAHRLRFTEVVSAYERINGLWDEPLVEWAALDAINEGRKLMQTDPHFGLQYYLQNSATLGGVPVDINVSAAWTHTTGAGIRIAVLDDGIDALHGNSGGGFSGDLVGAFVGSHYDLMAGFASGDDALNPYGNDHHGTAVAGIIAMRRNNGVGGIGVAPDAVLSSIRVFRRTYVPLPTSPETQFASDMQFAAALNWAWSSAGADIVNNSWGGGVAHPSITAAIAAGTGGRGGKGTLFVFSAGNNPSPGSHYGTVYPATLSATHSHVMAVSSINSSGQLATYAPTGGIIDVVTPSANAGLLCAVGDVFTLDPYDADGCNNGPSSDQSYTTTFSGTSASAPQVSGVAALLLQAAPTLTASQVKSRIRNTATPWPGGGRVGMGKVNAMAALAPYLPVPLSASIVGATYVAPSHTCTYSSSISGGSAPYSYEWRRNGVLVGTGSSVNLTSPGSGSFVVALKVTDGVGSISQSSQSVTVDPWTFGCGF